MSTLNIGTTVQISGTNKTVTGLLYAEGIIPAGSVIFVARNTVPDGYLPCNGANNVNRIAFATLFAGIGTVFGAGDGTNTFGVPDLRGEFIRGLDNGRGIDTGRTLSAIPQLDDFKSHTHTSRADNNNQNGTSGIAGGDGGGYSGFFSGRIGDTGGTETRPRNIALLACIKY